MGPPTAPPFDSDRNVGTIWRWEDHGGQFSKRVSDRFIQIKFTQHDVASASVVYLTRP